MNISAEYYATSSVRKLKTASCPVILIGPERLSRIYAITMQKVILSFKQV
jgi:hypothetical protein